MSVKRISDAEMERAAALAAGWRIADLDWEQKQERAAMLADKDATSASTLWTESLQIARANFDADDPRLGTSFANAACAISHDGDADMLLQSARRIWAQSPSWIDRVKPEWVARSSPHHLRMELKNRGIYEANARRKLHDFAAAVRLQVELPPATENGAAFRRLARWRIEKPPIFGDSRKLLAAGCLLMTGD